jgi:photosystem II stability/assembly factor-like uncharacterized protein
VEKRGTGGGHHLTFLLAGLLGLLTACAGPGVTNTPSPTQPMGSVSQTSAALSTPAPRQQPTAFAQVGQILTTVEPSATLAAAPTTGATPSVTPALMATPPAPVSPPPSLTRRPTPVPSPAFELPPSPSIVFTDRNHGWASAGGTILATTNGGASWYAQFTGSSTIAQLVAISPNVAWAATSQGLLGTTDGGQRWILGSDTPANFRLVDFVTPDVGWAVTGGSELENITGPPLPLHGGQLMQTADGGRNWTRHGPIDGLPDDVQSVCFGDAEHGWVGSGAAVWRTTTSGGWGFVWQAPLDPRVGWHARLGCAGASVVWLLFVGNGVAMNHKPYVLYRSTDGGEQWTAVFAEAYTGPSYPTLRPTAPELGSYPGALAIVNDRVLCFLAEDPPATNPYYLACSVDTGQTWRRYGVQPIGQGARGRQAMASADASHTWIVAGEFGQETIFATTDGGQTWQRQYP